MSVEFEGKKRALRRKVCLSSGRTMKKVFLMP